MLQKVIFINSKPYTNFLISIIPKKLKGVGRFMPFAQASFIFWFVKKNKNKLLIMHFDAVTMFRVDFLVPKYGE